MFELKPISLEAISTVLEKAMRYRLLNEPGSAESICLDVLRVDPNHQEALVTLLLAMTDRFGKGYAIGDARVNDVLARIEGEYERAYYAGIACERRAKAQLNQGSPGSAAAAYEWLRDAMGYFEKAEAIRPPANDDAILRWNTCARVITNNKLRPLQADESPQMLE
ncbi:MAG: hypothetical protein ABI882_02310 [Acidobacteriota bacterium]